MNPRSISVFSFYLLSDDTHLKIIFSHFYSFSTKILCIIAKFMDITLIAISIFILVAIVFLTLSLFKSIIKNSFIAADGSEFDNQSDLDSYQKLYDMTKPLFSSDDEKGSATAILGFQKSFLTKLKAEGFPDLKALVKYRKQFKLLSDLINT